MCAESQDFQVTFCDYLQIVRKVAYEGSCEVHCRRPPEINPLPEVYRRIRPIDRAKGLNGSGVAFVELSNDFWGEDLAVWYCGTISEEMLPLLSYAKS